MKQFGSSRTKILAPYPLGCFAANSNYPISILSILFCPPQCLAKKTGLDGLLKNKKDRGLLNQWGGGGWTRMFHKGQQWKKNTSNDSLDEKYLSEGI